MYAIQIIDVVTYNNPTTSVGTRLSPPVFHRPHPPQEITLLHPGRRRLYYIQLLYTSSILIVSRHNFPTLVSIIIYKYVCVQKKLDPS